ncbi:MAG: ketol-acid reductoisomerase [Actinobacteria bacterium]|nr:ketol-acid reductoisomerase [Actinomycetota bacterium]MBL7060221.1 ketol-acid reductoisomerase [Actinomycetota bacterium]
MVEMYYDKDIDMNILKGKKIAIIGYGSQGHAHSQNLRDSGLDVIVGELEDSKPWNDAKQKGFNVYSADETSRQADIIMFLVPDQLQKEIYYKYIEPNLEEGNILCFAHGFNIHYNQIIPQKNIDVVMIAPKGPGHIVRRMYTEDSGVPSIIAVEQDFSSKAKQYALAYAKAIGAGRVGIITTTFEEEVETDLFGEQVVLCGGTTELIRAGFDTLVEAGYQPEIAYFEVLSELKLIVDLIYESGITGMRDSISDTAEYGDMLIGKKVITPETRKNMKKILEDIQSGEFAKNWILENKAGRPVYNSIKKKEENHLVEKVGRNLRKMMPWIKKGEE